MLPFAVQNMFSAEEESGDSWDVDIAKDTAEECTRWGEVMHCSVDKASKVMIFSFF